MACRLALKTLLTKRKMREVFPTEASPNMMSFLLITFEGMGWGDRLDLAEDRLLERSSYELEGGGICAAASRSKLVKGRLKVKYLNRNLKIE